MAALQVVKKRLTNEEDFEMTEKLRLPFNRCSGLDRRKAYELGYFLKGGIERRSGEERRPGKDRRKGGGMQSEWSSFGREFLDVKEFLR